MRGEDGEVGSTAVAESSYDGTSSKSTELASANHSLSAQVIFVVLPEEAAHRSHDAVGAELLAALLAHPAATQLLVAVMSLPVLGEVLSAPLKVCVLEGWP